MQTKMQLNKVKSINISRHVEELLKNYNVFADKLKALKYSIENRTALTFDDVIEALNFERAYGDKVSTSDVSDRTGRIALIYKEHTEKLNDQALRDEVEEYQSLKHKINLLDYCLSLLPEDLCSITDDIYKKGFSWTRISKERHISVSTVGRMRKKALAYLSRLYDIKKENVV